MSNYITIETGYYKPFKENETDPELKVWADKYFEIIKRIHEVLSPYNERFEHFAELEERVNKLESEIKQFSQAEHNILRRIDKKDKIREFKIRELLLKSSFIDEMNSLFEDNEIGFLNSPNYNNKGETQDLLWRFDHVFSFCFFAKEYIGQFKTIDYHRTQKERIEKDLFELKEELRKCLLHRVWKSDDSVLLNESNIVSVEFYDKNGNLLFTTSSPFRINVYPFATPSLFTYGDGDARYIMKKESDLFGKDGDTLKMTYSLIDDIKATGTSPLSEGFLLDIKYGLIPMFAEIVSRCSIVETWKGFQSDNIDKIKKDKIRCGQFNVYNANYGIRVYT